MCGIEIAANDEFCSSFFKTVNNLEKSLIKIQLVFQSRFGLFAVGEIDVEKGEFTILSYYSPAFGVELCGTEAVLSCSRFFFGKCRNAAVASALLRIVPV